MATGYEDIDNLTNQTNELYDEQMKQQQNIINTTTQQAIDEIERNKQKAQEEVDKTNRALYTDYQKQVNPYGINAENLASQGLAGSGVAESARANYYNTYQNARSEAQSNANQIKADFDAQITKARQNGDLQLAQSALAMYQQKIQDMYNTYNLKFNQDQFNYQKEQDALSQSNWQKEYDQAVQQAQWQQAFNQAQFDYNKNRDIVADNQWQQQFDYQKDRDAVSDNQWQQEYELSKKNSTANRSSGSSSRSSKSSSSENVVDLSNSGNTNNGYEVTRITDNTIAIKDPSGQYKTLTITPNATDEQIKAWGERNGVPNILDYIG